MIAKVILKRRFLGGNTPQIIALLNELRSRAINQPGYISGETLTKRDEPNEMVIIATWQSPGDWHNWRDSPERNQYEDQLRIFQEGPTEYEEFLLGTPLSLSQA